MQLIQTRRALVLTSCLNAGALAVALLTQPSLADTATTQPAPASPLLEHQAERTELFKQLRGPSMERQKLLGDCSVLRDASKHAELRDKLIPLNRQIALLHTQLMALRPPSTRPAPSPQDAAFSAAYENEFVNSLMVALEDPATVAEVQKQIASSDPEIAGVGHVTMLQAQWFSAPDDASRHQAVNSIIAYLKSADPSDTKLGSTVRGAFFSVPATDPALREAIAAAYPNKSVLAGLAAWKQQEKDAALQAALLNKPMVVAGMTSDGKPLTTADWKGKVVLVDFWATWCGPCKASLPHVKELYRKYHSQGLEVVGVSNDTSKAALDAFLAADLAMAWPSLFDAKAAADDKWNPISAQFGVEAIPRMFLIDRNGNCATVTARENMDTMIPKLLAGAQSAVSMAK